ncbi:MAG: hypothetical protein QNJ54_26675 [Prochloraceae cyanobacterium]|nr:hypothetical protein [Prochloraceae cyanobacterium]
MNNLAQHFLSSTNIGIVRVEDLLVRLEEEIEVQKTLLNEVLSVSDRSEIEANLEEAIAQKNNLLSLLKKK